jgi:hypothetical protein
MEKQAVKFKDVDWQKVLVRKKSPVEKLVEEAELIKDHVERNAKKRKHDGKRIQHTR